MSRLRLLMIAGALASAGSTMAHAQTYVGVSGGLTLPDDSKNSGSFTSTVPATTVAPIYGSIPSGTSLGWRTEFDNGYNIAAQFGHRFEGGFRVEGEVNYSRSGVKTHRDLLVGGADIDGVDASVLTRGATVGATVGKVIDSGIGKQSAFGLFGNAYYDFNAGGSFQPFVGAGIGIQRNKFDYRPSNIDVGQGKDTNFAWQLMAGATAKVSDRFELFAQYNYRDAGKTDMKLDLLPATLNAKSRQSILSFGVRLPFGN